MTMNAQSKAWRDYAATHFHWQADDDEAFVARRAAGNAGKD